MNSDLDRLTVYEQCRLYEQCRPDRLTVHKQCRSMNSVDIGKYPEKSVKYRYIGEISPIITKKF